MACNNAYTVYWAGVSFVSANQIFSDGNLNNVAPDGVYSVGGIVREMVGGVLGPSQPCPTCLVTCGTSITGNGGQGRYKVQFQTTPAVGAMIVRFDPVNFPDKCVWNYDGASKSEYSSSVYGFLSGVIGTINSGVNNCNPDIINATGSMNPAPGTFAGTEWIYNTATTVFDNTSIPVTMGPYANSAGGGVSLTAAAPGMGGDNCLMVIPKPNILPDTVDLVIDGPCGGTAWNATIYCPILLNEFEAGLEGEPCCNLSINIYTAHVGSADGVGTVIGVHDWVFEDAYGITQLPAGDYPIYNNTVNQIMTVSADGVVTALVGCVCPPILCDNDIQGDVDPGRYEMLIDVGTATGVIIVKFDPGGVPDKCTWLYDGLTASEYTSPNVGYLQGIIGVYTGAAPGSFVCNSTTISNANGSSGFTWSETLYDWNGSVFVDTGNNFTMGPYSNEAAGGTTLVPFPDVIGSTTMVIPKPNAFPDHVNIMVDSPCTYTLFDVRVNCPASLPNFATGNRNGVCDAYGTDRYAASAHEQDGIDDRVRVHDFIFDDINGVYKTGPGRYPLKNWNGTAFINQFMTISSDGVVTLLVNC